MPDESDAAIDTLDTVSDGLLATGRELVTDQHHLLDQFTTIPWGWHGTATEVTFHIDDLNVGDDTISGGAGNNLIVGDDYLVDTPSITISLGGTPVFQNPDGSPAPLLWPWPWLCPYLRTALRRGRGRGRGTARRARTTGSGPTTAIRSASTARRPTRS